MRILEYGGLTTAKVASQYRRAVEAIARGDFRAADVKKLSNVSHGKFYRARLDGPHRLLFTLVRYRGDICALMLEVIENHDYASSRFLRGSTFDETKILDVQAEAAGAEAEHIRYLHPERTTLRFLDKPLSFDDAQDAVYRSPPPLVVVGSAGSGKTALTLEKLKEVPGEVLYVTQSAYLARNARDLYYAAGFEHRDQEATFLSYRELLESIRVPRGREAAWREFAGWFARQRQGQAFKNIDGHQAFEEIRGVILARAGGILGRAEYLGLGVRQSIFPAAERNGVYDLFERYCEWLAGANLYDPGLVAHDWLALAAPRYDFVVIDEVQDLTTAQLAVALRTLKEPDQFLLCGDSNQIVHPNFFSWSQVKTLFWRDPQLAERQELRVLRANFRNGSETTRVANLLLKIKHRRFGSIDRESNFLVDALRDEPGSVQLLADQAAAKRELDAKIRQSTQFAVLVMRDEDKPAAREHFSTPLLFSIHEAKGLEYDNIVLYRFVSGYRRDFAEIAEGVAQADLQTDSLDYRRARDKSDKSLEVYKFFVNALYVALTRAVKNVYWIESDTAHPLFRLLDLAAGATQPRVEAQRSSLEDWQKEARKLELQGKQEQADAIRQSILKHVAPPWPVVDEAVVRELLVKVFRERAVGDKHKRRLAEYAAFHDEPELAAQLADEAGFGVKQNFEQQGVSHRRRLLTPYALRNFKDVLRQCDAYGLEHRTAMNQTPLIAAAEAGNVALVAALLERGADVNATDHYGANALHVVLREAFRDPRFAQGPAVLLYELLAPAHIDLKSGERLVRVDKRLSEYFVFQTFWTLFRTRFTRIDRTLDCALDTRAILQAWEHLPETILRAARNKRQHLSHVLSRNEVARDYVYNRALFRRVGHGWYQLNSALEVRRTEGTASESWQPILAALNLPLVAEFSTPYALQSVSGLLASAGLPPYDTPIMMEPMRQRAESERRRSEELARQAEAERLRREREQAERLAERERRRAAAAARAEKPRWGTQQARRAAREELRDRIERSRLERDKDET